MAYYTNKPVTVEAHVYDGTVVSAASLVNWIVANGREAHVVDGRLLIETLEGTHEARPGDFVIKGIKGDFYPCKSDIFEATYTKTGADPC